MLVYGTFIYLYHTNFFVKKREKIVVLLQAMHVCFDWESTLPLVPSNDNEA